MYEARITNDATEAGAVSVQCAVAPRVSLALQQNAVPILRELTVVNDTDAPLADLRLELRSDPGFCQPGTLHIDHIGARQSLHIENLKVDLSHTFLSEVQEATRGLISLRLFAPAQAVLSETTKSIDLLAANEWGGVTDLPEILAAFVLPNDPAVARILK
jgi:hypothetical protein